jgi:cysteine desulfurase/selenocysteine lyase
MTKASSDNLVARGEAKPAASLRGAAVGFDVDRVREQFPILKLKVHGKPLVYLDNAATTQKPQAVIDRITRYYTQENANIHRGVYWLSQVATDAYEAARRTVRKFINAREDRECLFVRGSTEGVNLVAHSFGRAFLKRGDEILVSGLEHHSNIVPWQLAAEEFGAVIKPIPIDDRGEIVMGEYAALLQSGRVKLVTVNQLSNSLGTINDVKSMARLAHDARARILVDGAQWVAHYPTDVQDLGVDFYAFSGHKLYGPTGSGVLYGTRELLEAMPPYHGGGDMIETVRFEKTTYAELPNKFEAGTPDIAGVVGMSAAIEYVSKLGFDAIARYEDELTRYLTEQVAQVEGVRIIGTAGRKGGICSFVIDDPPMAAHDVGVLLDLQGIAVRTGHHCCMPVMERLKVPATVRASLAIYNTREEVDRLVAALRAIIAEQRRSAPQSRPSDEIVFPGPSGRSPQAVADELAEVFEFLDDPQSKNEQILDYAKHLPRRFHLLKDLTQRVPGCMSQVYMIGRRSPRDPHRFEFVADADAEIVRGEIAMLEKLYSGQRAADVVSFDVDSFFRRIGLESFLTQQRRTGLGSMVKRIREQAAQIAAGEKP